MTATLLTVLGIVFVVGQWIVLWLIWRLVRTFGEYTSQLVETHRQNLIIQDRQKDLLRDLNRIRKESA